jgi:hypothetical protein
VSSATRHDNLTTTQPALPLTVQLGFAGSRHLLEHLPPGPQSQDQLRAEFKAALLSLPESLRLGSQFFFTAVSQMAVGADCLFTELMAELGWPQRVLLPQPREEFLGAVGSRGPDFQPAQRAHAEALLDSPHIIEERVVSSAATRTERFEETNLRILEEADVLVCVHVEGAESRPGGTSDLLARARSRQQRVLLLTLRATPGEGPLLAHSWLGSAALDHTLTLPHCLQENGHRIQLQPAALPKLEDYIDAVKQAGSQRAGRRRVGFQFAAAVVIGTHLVATLAALIALKLGSPHKPVIVGLLLAELALLAWGYMTHRRLHDEHATRDWAMARLCAEIARSVRSLRGMPVSLDHLRQLAVPVELHPLIKTLNVLHLRSNRIATAADLQGLRQRYLQERLQDPVSGQEPYYAHKKATARTTFGRAAKLFGWLSVLAFVATLSKLVVIVAAAGGGWAVWKEFAGPLAILFPVAAAGVMSMATAMDWDARAHTFDDMHRFVRRQAEHLATAASLRELTTLALETEARLLGETLSWFGRRAYVGVA